jgi:hypothetical protein
MAESMQEFVQRVIRETDASYAHGQTLMNDNNPYNDATGTWEMQNAVANREAAVRIYNDWLASGGGTGGGNTDSGTNTPPPTPTPPYNPWQTSVTYTAPVGIKQADPDIVVFNDEAMSPELMVQLFFEEMGAVELASVSRSDIIDGILVSYNPIANLSWLRQRYNPNNIIAIANPEGASLADSHIDLFSRGVHEPYLDEDGNLVIEVDTILSKETIEVSFITDGIIDRITI